MSKKDNNTVKITSMLGPGSDLQGDFTAEGSARIDGNVNGNVKISGMLILGSSGKISGNVEAVSCLIGGEIQGNVVSPEKAELTATAKVLGDVTTRVIVIDEHAVFQGRCNMTQIPSEEGAQSQGSSIAQKMRDVLQKDAEDGVSEQNRSEEG